MMEEIKVQYVPDEAVLNNAKEKMKGEL